MREAAEVSREKRPKPTRDFFVCLLERNACRAANAKEHTMKSALFNLVVPAVSAVCLLSACGVEGDIADPQVTPADTSSAAGQALSAPNVPAAIQVPAGNKLDFAFSAIGVQIYACKVSAPGYAWVFQAPEATLLDDTMEVAGSHFAGPTWQSKDGSAVVGTKLAAATVDPTAIPWLLLQAVSHSGDGRMTQVTYVQRLNTTGGLVPAAADCNAQKVGAIARVSYTAKYFFYQAN
jgi:hypothetical protein